jgi:ribosomal protein S18 acetylase RimI-like enzyme
MSVWPRRGARGACVTAWLALILNVERIRFAFHRAAMSYTVRRLDGSSAEVHTAAAFSMLTILETLPESRREPGVVPNLDIASMARMYAEGQTNPDHLYLFALSPDGEAAGHVIALIRTDDDGVVHGYGYTLYVLPAHRRRGPFPCAGCHATEAFVGVIPGNANAGSGATNNGLDATTTDEGAGGVTGNPNQDSTFKVGSLRNIEVGAPYMHDGRFATLREVVDHYSEGIQDHPTLAPQLRVGGPEGAPLRDDFTDAQKDALVAFLETLADDTLNTDARWSDPFPADD